MTLTPLDQDAIRAAAEAAISDRVARIDAIAAAQQKVAEAEAEDTRACAAADTAIKEAQAAKRASAKTVQQCKAAVTAALRSALDGGWTAQQLRELGLTVPTSVISSPRASSGGTGKQKRTVRPRINVAAGAVAAPDAPDTGTVADASARPAPDTSPDAQELAHAGQGAQ